MTAKRPAAYHAGKKYHVSPRHPLLARKPEPDEAAVSRLVEQVKSAGQIDAVPRTPDGRLLGGRALEVACLVLKLKPHYRTVRAAEPAGVAAWFAAHHAGPGRVKEYARAATVAMSVLYLRAAAPGHEDAEVAAAARRYGVRRVMLNRIVYAAARVPDLMPMIARGEVSPLVAYQFSHAPDRRVLESGPAAVKTYVARHFDRKRATPGKRPDPAAALRLVRDALPANYDPASGRNAAVTLPAVTVRAVLEALDALTATPTR